MSASRLGQTLTLFGAVLLTALVGCTQSVPQTTGAASLTPASADRHLGGIQETASFHRGKGN